MKTTFEIDTACRQQNGLRKFNLGMKVYETLEEAKEGFNTQIKEMIELAKTDEDLPKNGYIEIALSKRVWDWELETNEITDYGYEKIDTYKLYY